MEKTESYNSFKDRMYSNLEATKSAEQTGLPTMLYKGIGKIVQEIQQSEYRYKPHKFADHIASSQTACVNLFVPVLESQFADKILKSLDACPKDFDHVAKDELYHGYRFEFWDSTDENAKGLLGDHTRAAGTDSDVAIAYFNTKGELCLWLIEHKLTEQEFSTCGAYKSKGNDHKNDCLNNNMSQILSNPDLCYYHSKCNFNYWRIMQEYASKFYGGETESTGCPFRGGMNQLWRNQLLAMALERNGLYSNVSFSVVHHPDNTFLQKTMAEYSKLTSHSLKFNSFTSDLLIKAAEVDSNLKDWIEWYKRVYLVK